MQTCILNESSTNNQQGKLIKFNYSSSFARSLRARASIKADTHHVSTNNDRATIVNTKSNSKSAVDAKWLKDTPAYQWQFCSLANGPASLRSSPSSLPSVTVIAKVTDIEQLSLPQSTVLKNHKPHTLIAY